MKNGGEAGSARAPVETRGLDPGKSAPNANEGTYKAAAHFTRAQLTKILAERLGLDPGDELPEAFWFWNVTVDGDFEGVTVRW
jgi:hypothetical protein